MHQSVLGSFCVPVAINGVICNWSVALLIRHLPTLKQSFGYLTASQAAADALNSTIFLLFICPMIIFDSELLKKHSYFAGYMLIFSFELSNISHFFISLNRFSAVYFPLKYQRLFSVASTKAIIYFTWLSTILLTIILYMVLCPVIYWPEMLMFVFKQSQFCINMSWYTDFCKFIIIISSIAIIDISTVLGVNLLNKRINNYNNSSNSLKHRIREMNFLKQTCGQGIVFVCVLISYFVVPLFVTAQPYLFFCTTFAFVSAHSIDGVITIACNPEFKRFVFSKLTKSGRVACVREDNNEQRREYMNTVTVGCETVGTYMTTRTTL